MPACARKNRRQSCTPSRPGRSLGSLYASQWISQYVHVQPGGSVRGERANFTGLVNGCVETKFCNKICVRKLSPRSTQCTPLHRSLISKFSLKIAEFFPLFFPKFRKFCQIFAEFSQNLTNFFRDFSKMQHFSEITNYPALIPPLIQNRRSFAGFWSRSVCLFLASSSARPAAALRDLPSAFGR